MRTPDQPDVLTPEQMRLSYEEARARIPKVKSPLEQLFYGHPGRFVTKWLHYFPIYEQLFARFRGGNVRMLEIGVQNGGSLELWRRYFGPEATLFGIDIDPTCASRS